MSKAFMGAYRKGVEARAAGKSERDCPYGDVRTWRGSVTFSRAFAKVWLAGFRGERSGYESKEGAR